MLGQRIPLESNRAGRSVAPAGPITLDSSIGDLRDVGGLGTFRALDNLKFDWVSFLQSTVTFTDDGGIMDKNVRPVIAPDEAVPFGIVKPFHGSVHFTWPPNSNF